MADYRKSFNFRNGVQVDNDNLVVNSNGLVGIGTTVPTEILDVRGTLSVVGLATADNLHSKQINVSGVTTLTSANIGNLSISSSGIITAVSGVVTFYGDGSTLSNLPTSQWVDVDVGLGFTSIYAAGNVGVATTNPGYTFQVGGNPNTQNGVGINSTGDINLTGIVTAANFYGKFSGNIDGNVYSTGVSTFTSLSVGSITASGGILTTTTLNATSIVGNLTGDVVGIATTARGLTGTPDITVGVVTASKLVVDSIEVTATPTGITTVTKLLHVGTGGTSFAALDSGRIGVGTAEPTSDFQIRKSNATLLEVISTDSQSRISIGQSVGIGNSNAILRFGNLSKTLELVNNDTGDVRTVLHNGTGAGSTGNFKWIYGQTNSERMTLTWDGNLGINQTVPTHKLHVVGTSTVTGNAWFGGNLTVAGSINGTVSLDDVITSNIYTTAGVSTISTLNVSGSADFGDATFVGLGTNVGVGTDSGFQEFGLTVTNGVRANEVTLTQGLNVSSGFVTSFSVRTNGGFISGLGTELVRITYEESPSRVVFTVVGVGSTSLQLF